MAQLADDLNFGVNLKSGEQTKERQTSAPDMTNEQRAEASSNYDLKKAAHPIACIFTFVLKITAILTYQLISKLVSDIVTFILVVVLCALDFWIVKNVTGRLLVGLRWWSEVNDAGEETWKFETRNSEDQKSNPVDKAFFWTSQLVSSAVWAVLLLLSVLSFSVFWTLLVGIAAALSITNLYGYYQCRGEHHKKIQDLKIKYGRQGINQIANRII